MISTSFFKVKIIVLIIWSYMSPSSIEHGPISFKPISFWYPFWELEQFTCHSNIGVSFQKSNRIKVHYLMWTFYVNNLLSLTPILKWNVVMKRH